MGDGRTYGNTNRDPRVESLDAMTADWTRLPMDVLEKMVSPNRKRGFPA